MKNGVPFDVAMSLDETDRMAYAVIFGEIEGNVFDWRAGRWTERK